MRVCFIWGVLLDLVKQLSPDDSQQAELVKLLVSIQDQPPPTGNGHAEYEEKYPLNSFWKDLPHWRAVLSDFENDAPFVPPYKDREGNVKYSPDGVLPGPWSGTLSGPEWTSLSAFVARLHTAAPTLWYLDVKALHALLEALEENHAATDTLDNLVPAAACWIIYAGSALKNNDIDYIQLEGNSTKRFPWSVGELYSGLGPRRFCPERWSFWRQRLLIMRDNSDLKDETRTYANRALAEMESLDQGSTTLQHDAANNIAGQSTL